jgi:hypothetical protein
MDLKKILDNKPFLKRSLFPNLYSWLNLEEHLNFRPAQYPDRFKRISKPNDRYWKAGGWLSNPNSWPPTYIQEELEKGVIYLKDCSRINKKINAICKKIEDITNWPTDLHIFVSIKPVDKTGFGKHNDSQHNLIVAQEGKLKAFVWDKKNNLVIDETLQNGDCVYVPAKFNHQIVPIDDKRYSFSFSMADYESFFQERHWINLGV